MKGLLDVPRSIVADLIRKRLWPIAVLFLAALVAVPVLMASSPSPPAVPAPGGAAVAGVPPPATGAAPAETTPASEPERGGRVRDPFFDPPEVAAEGEVAATETTATSAGDPAKAAGATKPAARKPAATKPAAAAKAKPEKRRTVTPPAAGPSARATGVHFRTAARVGTRATTRPIARLTPIGNRWDPAALYLGVMKVGTPYAVFVLGRRATSSGEGTCAAETRCRIIGLRPGDTQTVTVHTADGRTARRFVIHVTSVKPVTRSASTAGAMRAAVHPAGRSALRAMSRSSVVAGALGRLGYRRSSGLLYSVAAADAQRQAAQ